MLGGTSSVWDTLTKVVGESVCQGVAELLIMLAFLVFSVILLVYYIGRLVTLYIGTVLSPVVLLVWLIPGFRDFSETAMKTYISTVFVLFVHVVILQLAASLFTGMSMTGDGDVPNVLIAMVTGLATIIALLKTQGAMNQFSFVSLGPRSMRQLGGKFISGISHMTSKTVKTGTKAVSKKISTARANKAAASGNGGSVKTGGSSNNQNAYERSKPTVTVVRMSQADKKASETGATIKAPNLAENKPLVSGRTLPTDNGGIAKVNNTKERK